ncbi:ribonuclease HI family protein [Massilia brevitalea]|uniref:ribonuclease HI family protein n=1 Tax=Massilia brevitalea TaxID=442526 RepID=UPI0027382A33|nr:ribonuclease HI family protein [Massilia brevitalea]
MNDLDRLQGAASKTELAASRKLALRSNIPFEDALRTTLTTSAGHAGLDHLLDERAALRAAEAARALARRTARDATREAARVAALALRRLRQEGAPTAWRGWFDGSAKPNPGRCGIGVRLIGPNGAAVELSQAAGYGNSSEAEYRALILLLETAVAHGAGPLTVYGDSRVVIDDVNGALADSAAVLRPLRARVHALLARLPATTLRWIPRHKNGDADALSQRATAALAEEIDDIEPIHEGSE